MNKEKILKFLDKARFFLIASVLFLVPLVFAWFKENMQFFDLNKQLVFRGLIFILLIVILAIVLLKKEIIFRASKIWYIFLAIVFLCLANIFYSLHSWRTFIGGYERQQGIYAVLFYLLFFFLSVNLIKNKEELKKILLWIVASAAIVSCYGIAQGFGFDFILWTTKEGRAFSSIGQPNILAQWLLITLPLSFYVLWQSKKKVKLAVGLSIFLQLICFYYTYSRGGYIGLFFVLLFCLIGYAFINKKIIKWLFGFLIASLALVVLLIYNFNNLKSNQIVKSNYFAYRFVYIFDVKGPVVGLRFRYLQATSDDFKKTSLARKLFGYGKEMQENILIRYYQKDWGVLEKLNSYPDRAHNIIFDTWLEFGLVGLFLFASLVLSLLWQNLKTIKTRVKDEQYLILAVLSAIGGYFGAGLFGFPLEANYIYYYFSLAILFILLAPSQKQVNFILAKRLKFLLFFTVSVFCLFLWWHFDVRSWLADHYLIKAKRAETAVDYRNLFDNMDEMIYWYPEFSYYREQYVAHYLNAMDAVASKESEEQAKANIISEVEAFSEADQARYRVLNQMAHVYALVGWKDENEEYIKKATDAYEKILVINPFLTVTYQDYGKLKMWLKKYDEAIVIFERGLNMTPLPDDNKRFGLGGDSNSYVLEQRHYFHSLICDSYFSKKEWQKALVNCLQAEQFKGGVVRNLKEIADIYAIQKNKPKNLEYLEKVMQAEPENYQRALDIAKFYEIEKNTSQVAKYKELAEKIKLNNPDAKFIKVESSVNNGENSQKCQ